MKYENNIYTNIVIVERENIVFMRIIIIIILDNGTHYHKA